jgi:3-phosphoshikimate 1-carboxyvinyltransferase
LGARAELDGKSAVVHGGQLKVNADFYCGESGSTLRFFIPIALAIGGEATFRCAPRLIARGIGVYADALEGVEFSFSEDTIKAKGKLKAGKYVVKGDVSSQFISGLLFALPLLEGDSEIEIIPPLESEPYVDMTISVLAKFGVKVEKSGNTLKVGGSQKYVAQCVITEGDWSNAAFLDFFNYAGGSVKVKGLDENSKQGDKAYRKFFELLSLFNPTIDLSDNPDLAPVLTVLAAVKNGATFTGTARLKIKESDRAAAMRDELWAFGAKIDVGDDSYAVYPTTLHAPTRVLSGHNDHRIVMALACLCTLYGGTIDGAQAVAKSYPDFFDVIRSLGAQVEFKE